MLGKIVSFLGTRRQREEREHNNSTAADNLGSLDLRTHIPPVTSREHWQSL